MPMPKITDLYAFLIVDPNDSTESFAALRQDDGHWQPLVVTRHDEVEALKPIAKRIAHDSGRNVHLVRFTAREELPI